MWVYIKKTTYYFIEPRTGPEFVWTLKNLQEKRKNDLKKYFVYVAGVFKDWNQINDKGLWQEHA